MTSPASRSFAALRGLIYACGFIGLWTWLALSVRSFDSGIPLHLPTWLQPVGLGLAAAGLLLALLCVVTFAFRGRGTPAPFDAPREFVATGPYRYVRNPMYLGAFGVLLGAGLAASSPSILVLSLAFLALAHLFVILYEEPTLAATFGESYSRYTASVHRWVPRLR